MNIAEQVARYIEPFLPPDSGITWGMQPIEPARCATVYGTDTRRPGDADGARIQVIVRGPDKNAVTPAADADLIAGLLEDFSNGLFVADGYYIIRVELESGPAQMGADQNERQQYSINFRIFYV